MRPSLRFPPFALMLACMCTLASAPAHALRPGDVVTSFGNQGYVRIPFDRAGESRFDSAHFAITRYENTGLPIAFPYIYVAGIAGDRAAIVKLDGNGHLVAGFGDNGRAVSTQYGLGSLAGLGFAPNGDIVIAYSSNAVGDAFAHAQDEDFFVEVFDRDGQPRVQQQASYFGVLIDVNWVGVNTVAYGDGAFCDPDDYFLRATARSMAQASDGNLAIVGTIRNDSLRPEFASYHHTAVARFWFDGASGTYRAWNQSNWFPFATPADSCMGPGAFGYYVQGNVGGEVQWSTAAAYLTPDDLRVAGPVSDSSVDPARRYGGYHALPTTGVHSDANGSAWVPASGLWGPDSRNTEFHAMQWVPERPNLFLYGSAEDGFYAGGNKLKPIIAFDNGTQSLVPRWSFLNSGMSAVYSSVVQNALYHDGKHVLLGALRVCSEINDCTGEWDGYFVSRTGGEPDTLAFPPDHGFGDDGSRAYQVPGYGVGAADRAWAWDGEVLASNLALPGEAPSADLIVVGDFRSAGAGDPADFDWFVTRIRLRGDAGDLAVSITGSGAGSVTSSPAGIDCPATSCSQALPADAEVVLTATPAAGSGFSGWIGGCDAVVGAQCRVHIDGGRTVTAAFDAGSGDLIFADGFESAMP